MSTARNKFTLVQVVFVSVLANLPGAGSFAWAGEQPKLILQITVDALRGDLPSRFNHVLGDGGFRYLMKQGIYYSNAHYQHANTETVVGHASLGTGTVPAAHGMNGNVWFEHGHLQYFGRWLMGNIMSATVDGGIPAILIALACIGGKVTATKKYDT